MGISASITRSRSGTLGGYRGDFVLGQRFTAGATVASGRHEGGNNLAAVPAVQTKVGIRRQDERVGERFGHAYEAGMREARGYVRVFLSELQHSLQVVAEIERDGRRLGSRSTLPGFDRGDDQHDQLGLRERREVEARGIQVVIDDEGAQRRAREQLQLAPQHVLSEREQLERIERACRPAPRRDAGSGDGAAMRRRLRW